MDHSIKYSFNDKLVVVTAGSKGIGAAVAKSFYDSGAMVATCARDKQKLEELQSECSDKDRMFVLPGDIKDLKFLETFHQEILNKFKRSIDILVNNSGGPPAASTLELGEKEWSEAISGNLLSVIRMSGLVLPGMRENKWGRIINLTSTTAREPAPGMALSNVTRAGVAAYSKTLAQEVGGDGITVNTVLTGGCLTERFYSLVQKQMEKNGETLEEAMGRINKMMPVNYISTPDEFSKFVLFMASSEAAYLTGTAVPIDGGASKGIF